MSESVSSVMAQSWPWDSQIADKKRDIWKGVCDRTKTNDQTESTLTYHDLFLMLHLQPEY